MRTTQRTLYPGLAQAWAAFRPMQLLHLPKMLVRAIANRRDLNRLEELDDVQLRDIGLTRTDLDRARTSTFFENPFTDLKQSARTRARCMDRL